MAQYRNTVMTNKGAALLAKAQAGKCKIKFTRMATGSGVYSESEKSTEFMKAMTALKNLVQSFYFSSIEIIDNTSVKLTANITNHDDSQTLDVGYYVNEIGLYAQEDGVEGTEVLYSLTVADAADFLSPYNGYNSETIIQEYFVTVSNSAQVIIEDSPYNEEMDKLKEDLAKVNEDISKKADKSYLVHAIAPAASWTGTEHPFTCRIPVSGITATNDITVIPPKTAWTEDQAGAWMGAVVLSGSQEEGVLILNSFGEKPGVDIPIDVVIGDEVKEVS